MSNEYAKEMSRLIVDLNVAGNKSRLREIADEIEMEVFEALTLKAQAIISKIQKEG